MRPECGEKVEEKDTSGDSPKIPREPTDRQKGWQTATRRVLLYLKALGVPPRDSLDLAQDALRRAEGGQDTAPVHAALAALRSLLSPGAMAVSRPRSPRAHGEEGAVPRATLAVPPVNRGLMIPAGIDRRPWLSFLSRCIPVFTSFLVRRWRGPGQEGKPSVRTPAGSRSVRPPSAGGGKTEPYRVPWKRAARLRRLLITVLILYTTLIACSYMSDVLPRLGTTRLEAAIVMIYGILFAWVSIGFWEAVCGLVTLWRSRDPYAVAASVRGSGLSLGGAGGRTAIVMPICDEEVDRVFARLRATYQSLERKGQIDGFDFFILSDTGDPDIWVQEEIAWAELCRSAGGFNRIFYRHRASNYKRKSGNITDFCRRWGSGYRYMVVLDADSVMSGATIVRLVQIMEKNPKVGIVQTHPFVVNCQSLIARVQQFSNHVYGPVLSAGLHCLQLGDSHYWGHNAIIRVEPFMRHCGLPNLPGKPPLGGQILSHDFVEAALMRRAGWEVWLAHELDGSYEETPSSLLNELKRDRRWAQGNLQHIRLLFARGLFPAHRALFLHGILSYGSAVLWVLFLCLSTAEAIAEAFQQPDYFPTGRALFPTWPLWHPRWALTLLATTAVLLFLPKLLCVFTLMVRQRRARQYGGVIRLLASMLVEVALSAVLAPLRMAYHCKCLLLPLLGREVSWGVQQRGDRETRWSDAIRFHAGTMMLAALWAVVLFVYNRSFFWWTTPVLCPLILSAPLSVLCSKVGLGQLSRRLGLFLTPEEREPPRELQDLRDRTECPDEHDFQLPSPWRRGFVRAVADPMVNDLHRFLSESTRRLASSAYGLNESLLDKAMTSGPESLSALEKRRLLRDPQSLFRLHQFLWEHTEGRVAQMWGLP